jgi:hypothetical protein
MCAKIVELEWAEVFCFYFVPLLQCSLNVLKGNKRTPPSSKGNLAGYGFKLPLMAKDCRIAADVLKAKWPVVKTSVVGTLWLEIEHIQRFQRLSFARLDWPGFNLSVDILYPKFDGFSCVSLTVL